MSQRPGIGRWAYLAVCLLLMGWFVVRYQQDWAPIEGTVIGRDVRFYLGDEDEPNEYSAALNLVYQVQKDWYLTTFEIRKDSLTDWNLTDLTQAVEEARRYPVGSAMTVQVAQGQPEFCGQTVPSPWFMTVCLAIFALFGAAVGWESPALLAVMAGGLGGLCWIFAPRPEGVLLPEPLVPINYAREVADFKAFERVPLSGPHRLETLAEIAAAWGRPDDLWMEEDSGGRYLFVTYRDGPQWKDSWVFQFRVNDEGLKVLGPPQRS